MSEPRLFAVIPVYNGEKTISSVLRKVKKYVPANQIIIVDDGSKDGTQAVLNKFTDIISLKHDTNRGKGAALKTGLYCALEKGADLILTLDSDGQHNPAEIPKFLEAYKVSQPDVLIGSRMSNLSTMPFHRVISNKITSFLVSKKIKQKVIDSQSGFRLFNSNIFNNLELKSNYFDFETEVILKSGRKGYKIGHVDISTIYPQNTVSAIKIKDVFRFIKLYMNM